MRHGRRRLVALIAGAALALLTTLGVSADDNPASKVLAGQDILVPAGVTIDHDLYAFGSTIQIAGKVNGDLVAAGAQVIIDGTVTGDVFAAASEVTVSGTVGGDFRPAAARVTILGTVGEDTATATTTLVLGANGRIGGDLLFTATDVTLTGNVAGGINGAATDYRRDGTVGGTEEVSLATRLDQPAADRTLALALDALRQFVMVLLFGLAFLRFTPGLYRAVTDRARSQPLMAAGAGVVAVFAWAGTLIAIVVLMVLVSFAFGELGFAGIAAFDVIGSLLVASGLTFGLLIFSAFIADAIVGSAIGRLVALAEGSRWAEVIRLAVGSALVVMVTSFPGIGEIVKLLVILVGLGAFVGIVWDARRRPEPAVVVPSAGA